MKFHLSCGQNSNLNMIKNAKQNVQNVKRDIVNAILLWTQAVMNNYIKLHLAVKPITLDVKM